MNHCLRPNFSLHIQSKSDIDETFAEKIAPLLREEFATLRGGICYQLNQYWDKLFVFTTRSEEFIMKISLESKPQLEEVLSLYTFSFFFQLEEVLSLYTFFFSFFLHNL